MLIDHRGEDASYFDTMAAKAWSCCCGSATMVIDQRTRLLIVGGTVNLTSPGQNEAS